VLLGIVLLIAIMAVVPAVLTFAEKAVKILVAQRVLIIVDRYVQKATVLILAVATA
jgi:hypothetical protein